MEANKNNALRALIALLFLVWPVQVASAETDRQVYRLDTGDEVRVSVFNHADLSGVFIVDGNGAIAMPLIGSVAAKGRSVAELELAITEALKPDYLKNPSVSIEVSNHRPYYILGEIRAPGSYKFVSGIKVINAVAMAGGYTYRAKEGKVYIDRGGDKENRVTGGPDTVVMPGDIIHVPERFF